jgi:hypothetical protein
MNIIMFYLNSIRFLEASLLLFLKESFLYQNSKNMKKYVLIILLLLFACEGKVPYPLGNNYCIDYGGNDYLNIYDNDGKNTGTRGIVIDGEILELNKDSTFIIAFTKPIRKISQIIDPNEVINMVDEEKLIAKSKIREYWIVNKKMKSESKLDEKGNYYVSNVFGPYTRVQFIKKRKELGVSDSLQLIPTKKFLYLE